MHERDDAGVSPCPAQPSGNPDPDTAAPGGYALGDGADLGDAAASAPDGAGGGLPQYIPDDEWDGLPRWMPEDDFDADAEMARWVADLEGCRDRIPEEWERDGLGACLSLGDACDLDPAVLAAALGPGGLSPSPAFAQGGPGDGLRPGPALSALTEQAVSGRAGLPDDELTGALHAARRLAARAAYLQTLLIAEFGRRRMAELAAAKARGVPPGRRRGEFTADELACELLVTANHADARLERDAALAARLPRTLAGMAAGTISADRADTIAAWTMSLSDADAARADEILAASAPGLRADQLARKAAALEMKLNPDGVRARKEHARLTRQRVELRREDTGNASLAGRELDPVTALACKAYIDALAVRIRNHGHAEGPLSRIGARVMTELLQGRHPLDLIRPRPRLADRPNPGRNHARPAPEPGDGGGGERGEGRERGARGGEAAAGGDARDPDDVQAHGTEVGRIGDIRDPDDPGPEYPGDTDDYEGYDDPGDPVPGYAGPNGVPAWTPDEAANARRAEPDDPAERRGPLRPDQSAPPPANLNLIIPIGTLLGWSATPAQAGSFGLLDPHETQALAAAASRHPRTRWSITLTDPQGRAIAHGRARGQHPWQPPPPPDPHDGPAPDAGQADRLRHLIQALKIIFDPIAQDTCDHSQAENHYAPSRKLKDLIRARTLTCDAPGCNAQARYADLDHTTPYPDGPTDQCNLRPKCRRHHRAKQAPGWKVEQPQPGTARWTLPNGRTHTTTPTIYDC